MKEIFSASRKECEEAHALLHLHPTRHFCFSELPRDAQGYFDALKGKGFYFLVYKHDIKGQVRIVSYESSSERCDERALPLFTRLRKPALTGFSTSIMKYIVFRILLDHFYTRSEFQLEITTLQFSFFCRAFQELSS